MFSHLEILLLSNFVLIVFFLWDPYLTKDIQSKHNNSLCASASVTVHALIKSYWSEQKFHRWPSIVNEQDYVISYMVWQIVSQLPCKSAAYNTRQVSNFTLENIRANTSQFLYSFPHSISLWNSQSTNIQTTLSLHKLIICFSHHNRCSDNKNSIS